MWEDILSFIFPDRCIGCEREGAVLCALCERMITTKPLALSKWSAALFDYRNPLVKKAVWALKYRRKRALGKYFGTAMYREFFKDLSRNQKEPNETIILIPIPASEKALAMRGYNHAGVIAAAIAACAKDDGLFMRVEHKILYKQKENIRQVEAGGRERRKENVDELFGIHNGERLAGKTVILIDDVMTTGATVTAARKEIKKWGPKRVLALAVAH